MKLYTCVDYIPMCMCIIFIFFSETSKKKVGAQAPIEISTTSNPAIHFFLVICTRLLAHYTYAIDSFLFSQTK